MFGIKGNYKYEITDDLRLNVWHIDADEKTESPFWYQNVKPTGGTWSSVEEILEYLDYQLAQYPQPE